MKTLYALPLFTLFFTACGSSSDAPAKDTANKTTAAETTPSAPAASSCCFQSEEQFAQFLPATCGDVKEAGAGYSANLLCKDDPENLNSVTKSYEGPDGKRLSLQIRDYCAQPSNLSADYDKRMNDSKNDPVAHEFTEHQIPGADKCYSHYSTPNKTVYVLATIDGRFRVQITGQDAASADNALSLIKGLPLTDLAKFGK